MLECTHCGQPGASYSPLSDESGEAINGRYHPCCYVATHYIESTEFIGLGHTRRPVRTHAPVRKRPTVQLMRLPMGRCGKRSLSALRGVSAAKHDL